MDHVFELVGLVSVLPLLAGAVVSAMHLGRTRWAALLFGGFATATVVSAFVRLASVFLRNGTFSTSGVALAFTASSIVGFFAMAAVVAGVAGILDELRSHATARAAEARD